jgi:hypothetical protein
VHDTGIVYRLQRAPGLGDDRRGLQGTEPAGFRDPFAEGLAGDPGHDDVRGGRPVVQPGLTVVVDSGDAGVEQRRHGPGLAEEPRTAVIIQVTGAEDFDRDRSPKDAISGPPHLAARAGFRKRLVELVTVVDQTSGPRHVVAVPGAVALMRSAAGCRVFLPRPTTWPNRCNECTAIDAPVRVGRAASHRTHMFPSYRVRHQGAYIDNLNANQSTGRQAAPQGAG